MVSELHTILNIALGSVLINNIVLAKLLGYESVYRDSKSTRKSFEIGVLVLVLITIDGFICAVLNQYILTRFHLESITIIIFMAVTVALIRLFDRVVSRYQNTEDKKETLVLMTANTLFLGILLDVTASGAGVAGSTVRCFMAGCGFAMIMLMMAGIQDKIRYSAIPKAFQGLPIFLMAAALMGMAFLGFQAIQ